nr:flagellar export protein FliJ [uncultured Romboutsia sp.]
MSNFKFKLQKLLDIRINEEEESKLLYSQAQNKKNIVEKKLIELENSYKKYSDMSIAKDTITQKITMNYLSHLNVSIKETLKELEEKEVEVENAKKDFIDKRIKRRSLEVLKENQILEMQKEEERLEQISNDEFALYSYIRKTSNLQ